MVKDHPVLNCGRYGRGWKQAPPCAPVHGFWLGAVDLIQIFDTFSKLVGVLMRTTTNDQQ